MKRFFKSETPLYHIWEGMKSRCFNSNAKNYGFYGGRGITVCEEWANSFEVFHKWALENGYENDLTIDRIDNNGNYCPENCRWVTRQVQQRNLRSNVSITYGNRTMCVAEWAECFNIPYNVLWERLNNKWSVERALTTPVRKYIKGGSQA